MPAGTRWGLGATNEDVRDFLAAFRCERKLEGHATKVRPGAGEDAEAAGEEQAHLG